ISQDEVLITADYLPRNDVGLPEQLYLGTEHGELVAGTKAEFVAPHDTPGGEMHLGDVVSRFQHDVASHLAFTHGTCEVLHLDHRSLQLDFACRIVEFCALRGHPVNADTEH